MRATPILPAIPLLCHLWHELLGHSPPILDLCCLHWYAFNSFPCQRQQLANFTGTGTSIADLYFSSTFQNTATSARIFEYVNPSYYAICLALNILLTLMIITKLILHRRSLQHAIGTSNAITKVYTTIVIMLVESYALYAIALLSYILTWTLQSPGTPITSKLIGNAAVCGVFSFPNARARNDTPPHR